MGEMYKLQYFCIYLIISLLLLHRIDCDELVPDVAVAASGDGGTVKKKDLKDDNKLDLEKLPQSAIKNISSPLNDTEKIVNNKIEQISHNTTSVAETSTPFPAHDVRIVDFPDTMVNGFYIVIGIGGMAIIYFLIVWCLRMRGNRRAHRYGTRGNHSCAELKPLPSAMDFHESEDDDEEEVETLFEISTLDRR